MNGAAFACGKQSKCADAALSKGTDATETHFHRMSKQVSAVSVQIVRVVSSSVPHTRAPMRSPHHTNRRTIMSIVWATVTVHVDLVAPRYYQRSWIVAVREVHFVPRPVQAWTCQERGAADREQLFTRTADFVSQQLSCCMHGVRVQECAVQEHSSAFSHKSH